jgi:drug/metabolite transporter (DMT)-like permease
LVLLVVRSRSRAFGPAAWCLVAAVLFGASTPAAKPLLPATGPVLLSGLLYFGAALAVGPAAYRQWGTHRVTRRGSNGRLLGAVLLGGVAGPLLLFWGLSLAPAGSVSLWLTMETVATAMFAQLLFREHLGWRAWLAVSLVLLASAGLAEHEAGSRSAAVLVGLACVAWGLDNSLTALIDGYTTAQITFVKGLTAGVVATPIGWLVGGNPSLMQVLAALVIGALGYGLSLVLYVAGAQQLGATRSQLWFSTAPLFGLLIAWAFLGEPLAPAHGLAVLMMGGALWLLSSERHEHEHQHEALEHTHWHRHDDGHHDHGHVEPISPSAWHQGRHQHASLTHSHAHRPDLHHRHVHR